MSKNLTKKQIALLFNLYTTQFLGVAFFTEALIGILRKSGFSLENLGFIYMLGLFWVARFLWAPFIDRYSIKWIGHYKGWIIIFQAFMGIALLLNSFSDLFNNIEIVIILSMFFAFASSSQDIAVDALVLKTVSLKHRPLANALKSAGGIFGTVLGGGVGLILYEHLAWQNTLLLMSIITFSALIQVIYYKEEKIEENTSKNKIDFKQYISFWKTKERKYWFLFLLIYPVTIGSAFGLTMPMLVDLGWGLDKIGFYMHIVGYGIGVIASFFASWLISKLGKRKILILAGIGQVIGILLLLFLANGFDSTYIVMPVVGFIFACYTPSNVVMTTLMMDKASKKTPAAQFAIQQCVYTFSGIFFTGLSVSMAGIIGYTNVILLASLIGILAIYGSFKISLTR